MQTFLPHADFAQTAADLDRTRLGKQRVETLQIMKTLVSKVNGDNLSPKGWGNHPAVLMWAGYEFALMQYQTAIVKEWAAVRGYRDTCWGKTMDLFASLPTQQQVNEPPPWLGDPQFHLSHQSNLVRKMPDHYGPLYPGVPNDMEYVWPTTP